MSVHKFPFAIAYADTDASGIAYHGYYIEIAERARMDWLKGVAAVGDDIGMVVRDLSIKYICPLRLGDRVVVESTILKTGAASMTLEQKFVKEDTVCAILNITVAYIGADMRPKRIPDSLLSMLG